jgi:hypothetical protein
MKFQKKMVRAISKIADCAIIMPSYERKGPER